jgi:hypothetical protein
VRRPLALAAVALALAIAGCQRAPEAPSAPAPAVDHVAEARKALAAQSWSLAATHLRAALAKDPQSLFLHYNLAICATWLDLREDAIREFEWVVAHAPRDSEEAKTARGWLAENRDRKPTQEPSAPAVADDPKVGDSGIHGVVMWAEPGGAPSPQSRLQLFLIGRRNTPTRDLSYVLRSDREGRYELKRIAAGQYKLTDAIAGRPKWRLKVAIEPGQDLVLDLTPQNGLPARDDFPEDG